MNLKDSLFLEVPEKLLVAPLVYTPTVGYREDKSQGEIIDGICSNNTIKHHVSWTHSDTPICSLCLEKNLEQFYFIHMWYHYITKINIKVVRIKMLVKAKSNCF